MPIHVYRCEMCGTKFDRYKQVGDQVAFETCPQCVNPAPKSWDAADMGMQFPDIEPYFDEQLGKYVSSRQGLKDAMNEIRADSDGLVKPEWY